jgi:hypothetical protein
MRNDLMKRMLKISSIALCSIVSHQAFAILDVQASLGSKTGTFTPDSSKAAEKTIGGQAFQAAVHFHVLPIPMFTLGVGLGASTFTSKDKVNVAYTGNDTTVASSASLSNITGVSAGPDILFGVSIPATDLMPFLRYNYAINVWKCDADLSVNGVNQTFDAALRGSGSHIGLGLAWSPIPLLAVTGEYQMHNDTLSVPEVKTSGGITVPKVENKMKSTSILIGAQFNL